MNLERCFVCKLPVLELEGQFEKLDSYLLDGTSDELYENEAFGWCHSKCLSTSTWGWSWSKRLINYATNVLGYKSVVEDDNMLTGLINLHTQDMMVLRKDGVNFFVSPSELAKKRSHPGGFLLPVTEEMNLEFDDIELAKEIRDTLVKEKSYPLVNIVRSLRLSDRLLFPEAIQDGKLRFDTSLQREWRGAWVSAIADYQKFFPHELMAVIDRLI